MDKPSRHETRTKNRPEEVSNGTSGYGKNPSCKRDVAADLGHKELGTSGKSVKGGSPRSRRDNNRHGEGGETPCPHADIRGPPARTIHSVPSFVGVEKIDAKSFAYLDMRLRKVAM